jgi:hypothetical protein
MTESAELHARLMADARAYDPAAHHRSLLEPYRDVILLWRAKFMSYEQIAATLMKHGIRVSPAGVGVYCRRTYSQAELERTRREHLKPAASASGTRPAGGRTPEPPNARRGGPKIARDDI